LRNFDKIKENAFSTRVEEAEFSQVLSEFCLGAALHDTKTKWYSDQHRRWGGREANTDQQQPQPMI
jgi:hypothetical protein